MFSGVFQPDVDLPWLNTVDVDSTGYSVNNQFSQLLNQYHTAHLPVYDASVNAMHTVFFGGIGRYYVDSATGLLKDDPNVPFVRTISRVTRYSNGTMDEVKTGDMPGLMGSGAEFVPLSDADFYDEKSGRRRKNIYISYFSPGLSSGGATCCAIRHSSSSYYSIMIHDNFIATL